MNKNASTFTALGLFAMILLGAAIDINAGIINRNRAIDRDNRINTTAIDEIRDIAGDNILDLRTAILSDRNINDTRIADERGIVQISLINNRVIDERVIDERMIDERMIGERMINDRPVDERMIGERMIDERMIDERIIGERSLRAINEVSMKTRSIVG